MTALGYSSCFIFAILLSGIFTWTVRRVSVSQGIVKGPSADHHRHKGVVPRLGGIAIYLAFVTTLAFFVVAQLIFKISLGFSLKQPLLLLLPGSAMFLLGLCDDLWGVSVKAKFAVQIVAGFALFGLGFRGFYFHLNYANHDLGLMLSLFFTVLWVVLISNAFNLIDGLDGLATGCALFATVSVFVVSLHNGNSMVSLLALILAGNMLGFLRYNFNPATIFLGDSGSLFLGFMLSGLAIAGKQIKAPTLVAIAIPVVSFGLPLMETGISVLRRFLSGKPLFVADVEHIHHKLMQRGLTHRQVVIVLYGISALFALLSIFLFYPGMLGLVFLVIGAIFYISVQHLGYPELLEVMRVARRGFEQKQIIINNLECRKAASSLDKVAHFEDIVSILKIAFAHYAFDTYELVMGEEIHEILPSLGYLPNGKFSRAWNRPGALFRKSDASWSINLDLTTSEHICIGYLKLSTKYPSMSLMMDVNVLVSELQPALSKAAERVLGNAGSEPGQILKPKKVTATEVSVANTSH